MFFFATRALARAFAKKGENYEFVDRGKDAARRWAVRFI